MLWWHAASLAVAVDQGELDQLIQLAEDLLPELINEGVPGDLLGDQLADLPVRLEQRVNEALDVLGVAGALSQVESSTAAARLVFG